MSISDILILPWVLLFSLLGIEEHEPEEEPVQQEEVDELSKLDDSV